MTPPGIEPATFRFVAQHLNNSATAVPTQAGTWVRNLVEGGVEGRSVPHLENTIYTGCFTTLGHNCRR